MKKHLYLFLFFLFCIICSCSPYPENVNNETKSIYFIDSNSHYRIYQEDGNRVRYDIYNLEGEVVLSETTEHPLHITMVHENIIEIEIGMGTGISEHRYYCISDNTFSQPFQYVLANSNMLVAYMDVPKENALKDRKVIVQNIFDKSLFYKEYQLDFSDVDTPVVDAMFSEDGTALQITYLSGAEETQISIILS